MSQLMTFPSVDERPPMTLKDVLADNLYERVQNGIAMNPFRRLSNIPEVQVPADRLCQSVHINRPRGEARAILGGQKSHYYMHSVESAQAEIDTLLTLGIKAVYLQLQSDRAGMSPREIIDQFADMVARLRNRYGARLMIAVDPQGLCMGDDLRWGVRSDSGEIDAEVTLNVLAEGAFCLAQAGIDALVTIGRVNYEAAVARAGLDRHDSDVELWAFSTNSETPNAYFDVTAYDISKANTHQKIVIGNNLEMLLRALIDIAEGVDVFVQKPVENMQIIFALRQIIEGHLPLDFILDHPQTRKLAEANPWLFEGGHLDRAALQRKLPKVRLGSYEVSGTYSLYKHIEDKYSDDLAIAMIEEMYRNALFAAGDRIRYLIGRNMRWFAQTRKRVLS